MPREPTATRHAIIDAAEDLWARNGLDAVTLKQIVAHAGSANATAVQYHFGSRDGLLEALYQSRVGVLDATRARLLSERRREGGALPLHDVLHCLYRPFADLVDRHGRRSYAAFLFGLASHNQLKWRVRFHIVAPATDQLTQLLRGHFPGMSQSDFDNRLQLASLVYWKAVCLLDEDARDDPARTDAFLTEMIHAMAVILGTG